MSIQIILCLTSFREVLVVCLTSTFAEFAFLQSKDALNKAK